MSEFVVETRALRKRFGPKLAVADLSLSVRRGEVFGFLGPNGAGKTTSVKMLLGLVEPSGGEARVLGRKLGDRAARAKLGFLPEHFRFQDWLTGRELLRFHGRLHGLSARVLDQRIDALLTRVDLNDAASRPIRTYSKGMTQRVGLAQALLNEPELVFLDEPTSGLDPIGRLLVRDVIRDLRDRGTAVFLNSHLLGEVEATCDRVAFVKGGRVVHELRLGDPAAEHVEVQLRFAGATPALRERLAGLGEVLAWEPDLAPAAELGAKVVAARMRLADAAQVPELARAVVGACADLHQLSVARKSLEAWFLEVMGHDQRPG